MLFISDNAPTSPRVIFFGRPDPFRSARPVWTKMENTNMQRNLFLFLKREQSSFRLSRFIRLHCRVLVNCAIYVCLLVFRIAEHFCLKRMYFGGAKGACVGTFIYWRFSFYSSWRLTCSALISWTYILTALLSFCS